MRNLKYFFQFLGIIILFFFFKIIGFKYSSILSGYLLSLIGPLFRPSKIIYSNLSQAFPKMDKLEQKTIKDKMWFNYGRMLSEYVFIKDFRIKDEFKKKIIIENQDQLEKLRYSKEPVIFVSGHFNNFELMAMAIENTGIDLAAIYRPLNNKFLNPIMEKIRKKYICRKQIKKGISGTKDLVKLFKNGTSIALMIDQRVSEGIMCNFFNKKAFTTTIPAQFVKKYEARIVPIYIERSEENFFKIKVYDEIQFSKNDTIETITLSLNNILEKMIVTNPEQWIWTHNRWK